MKITIFTSTLCPFSDLVISDLRKVGLEPEVKIADVDVDATKEMAELTKRAFTPVTKITKEDGSFIVVEGYNGKKKKLIEDALGVKLSS
ncbi:MAG: glutaredoxin [Patescibacteria group bacterium]|nr:glutaredoxin [Patescibacteria group bacterium]